MMERREYFDLIIFLLEWLSGGAGKGLFDYLIEYMRIDIVVDVER